MDCVARWTVMRDACCGKIEQHEAITLPRRLVLRAALPLSVRRCHRHSRTQIGAVSVPTVSARSEEVPLCLLRAPLRHRRKRPSVQLVIRRASARLWSRDRGAAVRSNTSGLLVGQASLEKSRPGRRHNGHSRGNFGDRQAISAMPLWRNRPNGRATGRRRLAHCGVSARFRSSRRPGRLPGRPPGRQAMPEGHPRSRAFLSRRRSASGRSLIAGSRGRTACTGR